MSGCVWVSGVGRRVSVVEYRVSSVGWWVADGVWGVGCRESRVWVFILGGGGMNYDEREEWVHVWMSWGPLTRKEDA